MGWTVLYIAFGIVALWLLGEVLLQYKARLRWRLLAFVGFLGVVTGVFLGSVVVIVLGAAAFATGQTYVTLSFRRGFSTGWALGGRPGASKRRKTDPGRPEAFQDPTLQVSDVEYEPAQPPFPSDPPPHQPDPAAFPADAPPYPPETSAYPDSSVYEDPSVFEADRASRRPEAPVYAPEPLPEDTGSYGIYGRDTAAAGAGYDTPPPAPDTTAYGYPHPDQPDYVPAGADTAYAPPSAPAWDAAAAGAPSADYATGYGYDAYGGHEDRPYGEDHQYGYDNGQQYAAYAADPYAAAPAGPGMADGGMGGVPGDTQGYGAQPPYDPYAGQQGYDYPSQDPYAAQAYDMQPQTPTPPDGVWMPQQRATEDPYDAGQQPPQPYPYQGEPDGYDPAGNQGYGYGPNEQQYRY